MNEPIDILQKIWGHDTFRPNQLNIIESVLAGRDTLAILPTGGGKSLCFQVPALFRAGICVVVSPLIALMQDQVKNLRSKGIKAEYLVSGMSKREIDVLLDNCIYGEIKFLYVSPERLQTPLFVARFKQMNINLIAIDEAHCISQWGYDFRPPYLKIAEIRQHHPKIPVIALTATATEQVVEDIQVKLNFKKGQVFRNSFLRENLSYVVRRTPEKLTQALEVLKNVPGSAIVYVRTRLRTVQIAKELRRQNIGAAFYHGGLTADERKRVQEAWVQDNTRVMVATNAFGMGIDKPDVRSVVHLDLPPDLESYFQEAGRAGRDGRRAYAVLVWNEESETRTAELLEKKYPERKHINRVYAALGSFFQIAIGSGLDETFPFDFDEFCRRFDLPVHETRSALALLEYAGYIKLSDAFSKDSTVIFLVNKTVQYNFQVTHSKFDGLFNVLFRSYGGLFENVTRIKEKDLAKILKTSEKRVKEQLLELHQLEIVDYIPRNDTAALTYTTERLQNESVYLPPELYHEKKKLDMKRWEMTQNYLRVDMCRSKGLASYFGEKDPKPCGVCDVCLERKKLDLPEVELAKLELELESLLREGPFYLEEILKKMDSANKEALQQLIRAKLDFGFLDRNTAGKISIAHKND